MNNHVLHRLLHPAYRRLERSVHPLRYLFIEITQRCNLSCRHCGSDCSREQQRDELSTTEWLALFADLRQNFSRDNLMLIITGGEPLCHPDFDTIAAALKQHGLRWGMVSNGYALTERWLARLRACGLESLTISLDGLVASHDWLRAVPGSFARAVKAITHAAAANIPLFDVVTCVHPRNLAELPEVQRLLEHSGVRQWRLFPIFPKGRAQQAPELILGEEGFRQLLTFIAEQRRKLTLAGSAFSVQLSCEGYLPPRIDRRVRDEPYFCRAGISIGSVLCDGAIAACPNITRRLVQGNIRTASLKTVWEERFQPFRDRSWMRTAACADCREWPRCQGNSLHLWDDERQATAFCAYRAAHMRYIPDPKVQEPSTT